MMSTAQSETNVSKSVRLKIISLNANSLISHEKRADLTMLLNTHKPDVLAVCETKLNARHKVQFNNYRLVRDDRKNSIQGGGTAILVRDNIRFERVKPDFLNKLKLFEVSIIRIPLYNNRNNNINANKYLYIISTYCTTNKKRGQVQTNNRNTFTTEINLIFEKLRFHLPNNMYIVLGDLNAKHIAWGNPTPNNTFGNSLFNWLDTAIIKFRLNLFTSKEPSFPRCKSFLDLVLIDEQMTMENINIDGNSTIHNVLDTLPFDSDHMALQFKVIIDGDWDIRCAESPIEHKLNFNRFNVNKFQKFIITQLSNSTRFNTLQENKNLSTEDIDLYIQQLSELITQGINQATPTYQIKNFKYNSINTYNNKTIIKLLNYKSRLLSQIKSSNRKLYERPDSRELILNRKLKAELKCVKQLIKENYKIAINLYWRNRISNIHINDPNKFEKINQIFKTSKKQGNSIGDIENLIIETDIHQTLRDANIPRDGVSIDDTNGTCLITEKGNITKIIGKHFEKTYTVNNFNLQSNHEAAQSLNYDLINKHYTTVNNFYNNFINNNSRNSQLINFETTSITESNAHDWFADYAEVENYFRTVNSKKSSGYDNIPNFILKHFPQQLIYKFLIIFNNCLNIVYFPKCWKNAVVIPLLKPNKSPVNVNSYRAINLLSNISKIFEKIIYRRILNECERLNILPEFQFGFRKEHSTVHAANQLISRVSWGLYEGKCTTACLIDFEKAFDRVWTAGLIFKLQQFKFNTNIIKLINNMITDKTFTLKLLTSQENYSNNLLTSNHDITAASNLTFKVLNGLQQGTINSPILFSIYIADLKLENIITFADDTIIYRSNKSPQVIENDLQSDFDTITKYCLMWKLKLNPNKCEVITFRRPLNTISNKARREIKNMTIYDKYNRVRIENKDQVKYLGIHINNMLRNTVHVNAQINSAKKAIHKLRKLIYSKHLDKRVKTLCYMTFIRPILTYGAPIWFNISPSYMERLRTLERKCLRFCTKLYYTAESQYMHRVSNANLYESCKVIRIDNFIIKLIRNYYLKAANNTTNSLIKAVAVPNVEYFARCINTQFSPPEIFLQLDIDGKVQDADGVPVLYHWYRSAYDKSIQIPAHISANTESTEWRYKKSVSNYDRRKTLLSRTKFWWIRDINVINRSHHSLDENSRDTRSVLH